MQSQGFERSDTITQSWEGHLDTVHTDLHALIIAERPMFSPASLRCARRLAGERVYTLTTAEQTRFARGTCPNKAYEVHSTAKGSLPAFLALLSRVLCHRPQALVVTLSADRPVECELDLLQRVTEAVKIVRANPADLVTLGTPGRARSGSVTVGVAATFWELADRRLPQLTAALVPLLAARRLCAEQLDVLYRRIAHADFEGDLLGRIPQHLWVRTQVPNTQSTSCCRLRIRPATTRLRQYV